jgi:hypothetical protein
MPVKMNMFLSNGNPSRAQIISRNITNLTTVPKPVPTALNAPIISRIHTVKPGCGSCGRH